MVKTHFLDDISSAIEMVNEEVKTVGYITANDYCKRVNEILGYDVYPASNDIFGEWDKVSGFTNDIVVDPMSIVMMERR